MELVVARLIAVANSIAVLAAAVVVVPIAVGKGYFETAAANILVETHILVMLGLELVEHFVVVVAHLG